MMAPYQETMRFLPREHGATAIWLASLILGIALLPGWPAAVDFSIFMILSVLVLVVLGQLTGGSSTLIRMERNRVILPISSASLTILAPLGSLVCTGYISERIIAVWTLFITYVVGGVAYTQAAVRSLKRHESPSLAAFMLPLSIALMLESVVLNVAGWLSMASVAVIIPLFLHWIVVSRRPGDRFSLGKAIRRVGFTQAATMIVVSVILALVARI